MKMMASGSGVEKVAVWVVAADANGAPTITRWDVGVTRQEMDMGYQYEMARGLASEAGYEQPMVAFDETDPAGKTMLSLMGMQSIAEQEEVPGDSEAPAWSVPVTTDVTLSAVVRVRANNEEKAIQMARQFVATGGGSALLSLDDCNYKGIGHFYCPDRDAVLQTEELEEAGG
jgi:hypothetical protein